MKVGFIGLGNQGSPIARRIARSGFKLVACDISPEALAAFDEPGVTLEADPIAAARQVEVLCTCVRTDDDLRSLVAGGTLFAALGQGGTFIIHSTVDPDLCRELAGVAKSHGVDLLDAGVSGADAALSGGLAVYVGGDAAAFARVKPLLDSYGKLVTLLGPVGRGMEAKLLNNLVSIANYGMSAAILDLGARLNFDRDQLRQALLAGSADSFALKVISGMLSSAAAATGVRDLLTKDLKHAQTLAPADDPAMAALVAAGHALLDRLGRAVAGR